MEHVAVIGASPQPERYSYKAVKALKEKGHTPLPVAKGHSEIDGIPAYSSITEIPGPVNTVSIYVRPEILKSLADDIIGKHPSRVIMNPGTEDDVLRERFEAAGIQVVQACTLVMLSTGQF